jgi:hypothetical protein
MDADRTETPLVTEEGSTPPGIAPTQRRGVARRFMLAWFALGACASLYGGRTQSTSSADPTPSQDVPPVGATRVPLPGAYRFDARVTEPGRFVARSRHEWQLLWRYLFERAGSTAAPAPEIDFSKEMVIVVAMGVRTTTGYLIVVDSVYILGDETNVVVRSETPGEGCGHLMGWTWPVDVVRAPRNERPVRFIERAATRVCQR